jgi:hypothetical protein
MLVLSVWYAGRTYPIDIDWSRMAIVFAGAGGAMILAHTLEPGGLIASGLVHLAIGSIFAIVVLALLRGPWRAARTLIRASDAPGTASAAR